MMKENPNDQGTESTSQLFPAQDGTIYCSRICRSIAQGLNDLGEVAEEDLRQSFIAGFTEDSKDPELHLNVSWFADYINDLYDNGDAWIVEPSLEEANDYSYTAHHKEGSRWANPIEE